MGKKSSIFEETYRKYVAQIAEVDLEPLGEKLGIYIEKDRAVIPFFNKHYDVSAKGIFDHTGKPPSFDISVMLSKYILLCPENKPMEATWVSFRDFPDSGPLLTYWANDVENAIADYFSGHHKELEKCCMDLGGILPKTDLSYDLTMQFTPLPKVPLLMLFNDVDDEFSASCSVLFEKRAEKYLDAECLAILGAQFFHYLKSHGRAENR